MAAIRIDASGIHTMIELIEALYGQLEPFLDADHVPLDVASPNLDGLHEELMSLVEPLKVEILGGQLARTQVGPDRFATFVEVLELAGGSGQPVRVTIS
jgi:hypothetical protein